MHAELSRARALYFEWRLLPERERGRVAPFAHEVKELALDLRGREDPDEAVRELTLANDALWTLLHNAERRAA
jgi:hypothetical protein